jgi:hypothetical protein
VPPMLAISRNASVFARTPSQPSCRISPLFVRLFVFTAAFSRSPLLHSDFAAPAAGGMPSIDRACQGLPKFPS